MSATLTQTAFRTLALASIQFYRAWLSPIKGFRCAWGAYSGRDTCSGIGLRAIRRAGLRRGWLLMQRQFDRCVVAADALRSEAGAYRRLGLRASQRGFIDCDVPDLPDADCCDALECAEVADCSSSRSPRRERTGSCRRDCRACASDCSGCCSRRRSSIDEARERALHRARERHGRRNAAGQGGAQRAT